MKYIWLSFLVGLTIACGQDNRSTGEVPNLQVRQIPVPSEEGGASNLFVPESGDTWLSWVEYVDDTTDALLISSLDGEAWAEPSEVARGSDWFVNWADFPSVAVFKGTPGAMAAHWLQKSADGTYEYDVRVAISLNSGQSWSESFIIHTDGVPAEHGFVTMMPLDNGRIFATWLDGRNTKGDNDHAGDHDHGHGHGGSMTLRTAEFDVHGNLFEEAELDQRVCECCQTDAAITDHGPVVVYRDRSDSEVRDISFVRKVDGQWTAPISIHNDNWEIAGCPVNGPAIDAQGNKVVVAWYTVMDGEGRVMTAFSSDGGRNFGEPIRVDDGKPLGRVDVLLTDENAALVSWLERTDDSGEIRIAKATADGKIGSSIPVITCDVSRQSGFPVLERKENKFLITWTQVAETTTIGSLMLEI